MWVFEVLLSSRTHHTDGHTRELQQQVFGLIRGWGSFHQPSGLWGTKWPQGSSSEMFRCATSDVKSYFVKYKTNMWTVIRFFTIMFPLSNKHSPLTDHSSTTLSRSMRAVLLIFSPRLMGRNWFGEKTSQMCVLFSSFFNRTSESRKCVRHEICPGYLLSHAPASRLPSNSSEPPVRGADAHAFTHNVHAAHTSTVQVCMFWPITQWHTNMSICLHKAHF